MSPLWQRQPVMCHVYGRSVVWCYVDGWSIVWFYVCCLSLFLYCVYSLMLSLWLVDDGLVLSIRLVYGLVLIMVVSCCSASMCTACTCFCKEIIVVLWCIIIETGESNRRRIRRRTKSPIKQHLTFWDHKHYLIVDWAVVSLISITAPELSKTIILIILVSNRRRM